MEMEKVKCNNTYMGGLKSGTIGYFLAMALFFSLHYMFLSYQSFDSQIRYDVGLIKGTYTSNEPLRFVSRYDSFTQRNMQWDDILFCEAKDGIGFVSFPPVASVKLTGWIPESTNTVWTYTGGRPDFSTHCYLQATMTINLSYGIQKSKQIVTPVFEYKYIK